MPDKSKVYVIDDDAAMRDSLNFLLDAANYDVMLFDSASNFLEKLPLLDFGCVVSDVRMPGVDGIELLRRMKALDSRFPTVIIASLTGYQREDAYYKAPPSATEAPKVELNKEPATAPAK